jgi:D-sedoheptulose 7-phosphate isomerase
MSRAKLYFDELSRLIRGAEVTDGSGKSLRLDDAFARVAAAAHSAHQAGNKLMFIGNGGSAGIASHLAIDFSKNGGLRSLAFNDAAALTCLANDLGYDAVFSHQVELHGCPGDILLAISSSGRSRNILAAAAAARERRVGVITFSGFDADNDLRFAGDVNFYVRSDEYGFVEIAHLSLCHAILDLDKGWKPAPEMAEVPAL